MQLLVGQAKIIEGRKHGILKVMRDELQLKWVSNHFQRGRLLMLYDGWLFTSLRDSVSFALFFGMFETVKQYSQNIIRHSIAANEYSINANQLHWVNGLTVVASGAFAGSCHQMVTYPLEKWRSLVLNVPLVDCVEAVTGITHTPGLNTKSRPRWTEWVKVLKEQRLVGLYRGIGPQLWRSAPPSALALFGMYFSQFSTIRNLTFVMIISKIQTNSI